MDGRRCGRGRQQLTQVMRLCCLCLLSLTTQSVVTLDAAGSSKLRESCADGVVETDGIEDDEESLLQYSPDGVVPVSMLGSKQLFAQAGTEGVVDPHHYRERLGLRLNGRGDLAAFLTAVSVNSAAVLAMFFGFSLLRKRFPEVYSSNTLGDDPRLPLLEHEKTGIFAWYHTVQRILQNENLIEVTVGLDHCMLIEYTSFSMKLMTVIGVPLVLFLTPLHFFLGTRASDLDLLSMIGFSNVDEGSRLCWIHGFVVWFVVGATQMLVFEAQGKFIDRRFSWLKRMPFPRANTILVENIDQAHCSDAKLREWFNLAFDEDVVEEAYVVRDTTHLLEILLSLHEHQGSLEDARAKMSRAVLTSSGASSPRPRHHRLSHTFHHLGEEVDTIDFYTEKVRMLQGEAAAERSRIRDVVDGQGLNEAVFCNCGFVTFRKRVNCEHALKHLFSRDLDTFVVSAPPDPRDIRFHDLQADHLHPHLVAPARQLLGYGSVAGIFFCFLPLVTAISSVTSLSHLGAVVPFFDRIVTEHSYLANVWDGIASSIMLTTLMSLVPTLLIQICEHFFTMKSDMWMQQTVQKWYFCFLLVFVVLVTCIGSSLSAAVEEILEDPRSIIWRMADSMPKSTNFYLEFFLTQTAAHVGFLARFTPLVKFLMFQPLLGAERAKEHCEPESQAYYGIGSRSAILTLLLVTALVFCTLQPLICVLCFAFFAIVRLVYGNLFLLAETAKVDLGGVFWVTQLKQTQQGLVIYVLLMCGVLFRRAGGYGPGVIALSSLAFIFHTYIRFHKAFPWESMPFNEVVHTSQQQGTVRRMSMKWKPQSPSNSGPLASISEKGSCPRRQSFFDRNHFRGSFAADRYEQKELLDDF